jgi:glucose-6-phosphate isomerase
MATEKGRNICVMMPYSDALYDVADWFRQLWAESLGKRFDTQGREVEVGQTPVKALGTTDQHSQVQLYLEGPHDKVIDFIRVERYREDLEIPGLHGDVESVGYLGGHRLSELIQAEGAATEIALANRGRPSCTFLLPQIDPKSVGELLFLLEYSTAISGALYRINPFDQPGVEEGKHLTYGIMGRAGYEEKRKEVEERPSVNPKYVV